MSNHKRVLIGLLFAIMLMISPIMSVHASSPVVNSGQNVSCSTITCSITLTVSNLNDGLFLAIGISDSKTSNGSPIVVLNITDNHNDVWIRDSHVAVIRDALANCGGICFDAEVWSAQTNVTGDTTVTMTVFLNAVDDTTVASIQGYDISNIFAGATYFRNAVCINDGDACHDLQTLQTSSSNPVITGTTFELAALQGSSAFHGGCGSGGYEAGTSYTLFFSGTGCNAGGGEYSLNAPSPTSYDFSVTLPSHAGIYALAGATFTSVPTVITQTSSTTVDVTSPRNDTLLLYLAIIIIFLGLGVGMIRITRGADRLPEAYQ